MYSQRKLNEKERERVPVTQTREFVFRGFPVSEVKDLNGTYLIDDSDHLVVYKGASAIGRHDKIQGLTHYRSLALRHDHEKANELLRYIFSGMRLKPRFRCFMKIDCGLVDVESIFGSTNMLLDYEILFPQLKIINELKKITNNRMTINDSFAIYDVLKIEEHVSNNETKVLITLDQIEIDEDGNRYLNLANDVEVAVAGYGRLEHYIFDYRSGVFKCKETITKNRAQ